MFQKAFKLLPNDHLKIIVFHFDLETDLKCDILLLQTAAIISAQLKLNRFLCHILVPNMDWEIFIFL